MRAPWLLLGSVISTPFVLRIFASEISNQVSVIHENSEAAFLNSQQRSTVGVDSHVAPPSNDRLTVIPFSSEADWLNASAMKYAIVPSLLKATHGSELRSQPPA